MFSKQLKYRVIFLLAAIILYSQSFCQNTDTLKITIQEAEQRFIKQNLLLLAQQYNVGVAKAQVMQARLFPNPNLSLTANMYNPEKQKVADISNNTGEYIINAQQLIRLAGKRNKEIAVAEANVTLSENRLYDLLRTLRYSLRSTFYNAWFTQNSIHAFDTQIVQLERLSNAYDDLQAKGIVTLKDAVRIRSLLYSLKAEQTGLQNQLNDMQGDLQLLLQNNKAYIDPVADTNAAFISSASQLSLHDLTDSAFANRYDLKLASNTIQYNQRYYELQQAYAKPDLTVGAQFDKRGSFVDNASFLTLAMDLPFRNRNQGNIRAAKISVDQSKVQLTQQQQLVENQVQKAYIRALNTDRMLTSIDKNFRSQFERLLQGITENFKKKNISLIEFTDFYESYKNNILQFNQLQNDRMQALELLQFAVGKNIFTY